ncbi:hypothetical protein DXT99_25415 [Pontibacter diazotrophicus]|uniref:Uncharacterized protein n=1 Tax=Pontibacter diazotrophicus TaxID=1400979 RepID=A0A3D8L0Z3_9BACT|nr:hypothetical protein [Pontibacter diazotrophicus]RDV11061.1 hypothetical protein DXT99_25415 [Pontibacter diazotrophicus]
MKKIASHMVACIVGTLVIYGLLKFESFIHRIRNESYDEELKELAEFMISDIVLLILFFAAFASIQFILVKPVFNYLTKRGSLNKQNLVYTWLVFSLSTGLFFGIFFGDMRLGIKDVIESIGLGVAMFLVYYSINFITYFKLIK